ncbi:MAG: class I SAM-dependent methyltransferase [Geminicoccaceae bacterium]
MQPHFRRHTDVLRETVPLDGRTVLEIGCGGGQLLGWLAREGAAVVGLDPGLEQLARACSEAPGAPLVAGRGEALPFESGRFDLVLFFNSLHHVPLQAQWQALAEAARVLVTGGDLLVVEPLPEGDHFALLQPLEDETEVRREAFRALHAASTMGLRMVKEAFYATRIIEPDWPSVRARFVAVSPDRAARLAVLDAELERLFESSGEAVEGGRAFVQPMRLNLLRRGP